MAEPTLRRGHGPADWVRHAQEMLNYALSGGMHIDVPVNGVFDEAFEHEVEGFQRRAGIHVDGEIGHDTWEALKAAVEAKKHASDTDEDRAFADPTPRRRDQGPDDNVFRETTDGEGNTVRHYDFSNVDEDEERANTITVSPGRTDFATVVSQMVLLAKTRNGLHLLWVREAVEDFKKSSEAKIAEFVSRAQQFHDDIHLEFPWGKLVEGLDYGLGAVFDVSAIAGPEAGWIYEQVKSTFVDHLLASLTARANAVPGLQARLEAGVDELVSVVTQKSRDLVSTMEAAVEGHIRAQMQEYSGEGQYTGQDQWITEMVTFFGFPEHTQSTVMQPVLYWLNEQFDVLLHEAHELLLRSY